MEREIGKELLAAEVAAKEWWENFMPTLYEQCTAEGLWPLLLPSSAAIHRAVADEAVPVVPALPIPTAVYGTVMRSGPTAQQPLPRPNHAVELSELAVNSYAFVSIEAGDAGEEPFALACCLVQLPPFFPAGFDYKDPKACLDVKWWRPVDITYKGRWQVWFSGNQQWESPIERGTIVVADVGLREGSNNLNRPLGQRFARVLSSSLRLLPP